jgi:CheY-like chemotaxis protein
MSIRVLLIEDNHINRKIMGRLLRSLECDVIEASSKSEAVEASIEQVFDLILIDLFGPSTGMETLKSIQEQSKDNKDAPVVVATSSPKDLSKYLLDLNVVAMIRKPLQVQEVKDLLKDLSQGGVCSEFDCKEFEKVYVEIKFRKDIINSLNEEKDKDLSNIKKAYATKDLTTIYNALHYMKGTFSYIKAFPILRLTQDILDAIKAEDGDTAYQLESMFYEMYERLYKDLNKYKSML